jgi:hypothetical protein
MKELNWVIWFIFTIFLSVDAEFNIVSRDDLGFKFMNFFQKPGHVLIESSITVSNVSDILSCQLLCLDHRSCLSINVGKEPNETTLQCGLNNSTSLLKPLSLRRRREFDFYGLAVSIFSSSFATLVLYEWFSLDVLFSVYIISVNQKLEKRFFFNFFFSLFFILFLNFKNWVIFR